MTHGHLALVFLVVAFNLFGDAIRDALAPLVRSEAP